MGAFSDAIFGKEGKSRSGATKGDMLKAIDFIEKNTAQAREDLFSLIPQAASNRLMGTQGAFDLTQQSIDPRLQAFQGGNMQAQGVQSAGLPQQINALLGLPTDFSGLQPQALASPEGLPIDTSFLNEATMPEFNTEITAPAVITDDPNQRTQMLIDKFNSGKLTEERALERMTKDGNRFEGVTLDQARALLGGQV